MPSRSRCCSSRCFSCVGPRGLARLGVVALDGTKGGQCGAGGEPHGQKIDQEVAGILAEAEATDAAEDALHGELRGDELPAALRRREDRLARLVAAKQRLAREAAERAAAPHAKVAARAAEEAATGKRRRGRKPTPRSAEVDLQAKANPTDPDSGIMKTAKGWVQGRQGLWSSLGMRAKAAYPR